MGAPHCPARIFVVGSIEAGDDLEQVRDLAARLRGERIARVWTSLLPCSLETAELVAAALGVGVEAREELREHSAADLVDAGRAGSACPNGALGELADRHRGEAVLLVGHGTGPAPGELVALDAHEDGWRAASLGR